MHCFTSFKPLDAVTEKLLMASAIWHKDTDRQTIHGDTVTPHRIVHMQKSLAFEAARLNCPVQ